MMLVWFYLGWCWLMKQQEEVAEVPATPPMICNKCKIGAMHLVAITDGDGRILSSRPLPEHSLAWLDSG